MTVDKYLRIKQVAELTGLSRATIYNMEKAGTFPEKTHLGKRAVAWRESVIATWMESRQHVEKSEQEKRPGKPPTKKLKPIELPTTATIENTPPRTKASGNVDTQQKKKAAIAPADDDWSEPEPQPVEAEAGGWEVAKRRKAGKVSLPNVGVLGRSSKEIPIVLNPAIERYSKVVELKDFTSKKTKEKP